MRDMMKAVLLSVAAISCIALPELSAQRQTPGDIDAAGQRVRVTERDGRRTVGRLVEIGVDSVSLLLGANGEQKSIARSVISGVSVSRGVRGNALKGLAIGAGGGLLMGAVMGGVSGRRSCRAADYCFDESGGFTALAGGILGAVGGGLTGVIVGAIVRTEKWTDPLALPEPRVSLGIAGKGVGVRIRTR